MKKLATITLALLCTSISLLGSPESIFQKAKELEKNEKADEVKLYTEAANEGNSQAQYNLGCAYLTGSGVEKNKKEALKWIRKAAEQGNMYAESHLGFCYIMGDGIEQNDAEGIKWLEKSAKQGYTHAQLELGNCYLFGRSVKKSPTKAIKWLTKAAEQGNRVAMMTLGVEYIHCNNIQYGLVGKYIKDIRDTHKDGSYNIKKNILEGKKWLTKALELGDTDAVLYLATLQELKDSIKLIQKEAVRGKTDAIIAIGSLYLYGEEVEGNPVKKDIATGRKWLEEAAWREFEYRDDVMLMLATHYYQEGDFDNGMFWLKKAAELGNPDAKNLLTEIEKNID